MTELEVEPYDPARRDELLALLDRVRGHRTEPREFEWWFDGNPVGPRTIFVARVGEDLAGVLGASFYRTVVAGRETLSALPLWAVTDEQFRGRGIFQRLNAAVESAARAAGATLELGFTNRLAGPIYVGKLGWQDVHRLRYWARPLLPSRRPPEPGDADRFGPEQEQAYRAAAPARGHFVRDAAYLNWRYADAPHPYRLLLSRNGYAVVGRRPFRGVDTAYVADLVAASGREARVLLGRCVRAARGARVLLALVPAHAAAHAAVGFAPTHMTIRLIGHALEGELPLGSKSWHFTLGDTDYF